MVTMDVNGLYNNIDDDEVANACFEAMEGRKTKIIHQLILFVLKNNVFSFGNLFYQQKMGTAMGTPMAPNYANLFFSDVESRILASTI